MAKRGRPKRGFGRTFKKTYRDKDGNLREVATYTIAYVIDGKEIYESTGSTDAVEAETLLKQRTAAVSRGELVAKPATKATFETACELIERFYKENQRDTLYELTMVRLPPLRAFFAGWRLHAIDTPAIKRYISQRLDDDYAPATVNRELSALRKALGLAFEDNLIQKIPLIHKLKEDNARRGFFEREELNLFLAHLPIELHDLMEIAYITGWRMRSELLRLQWTQVDFNESTLWLHVGETKNNDARFFPLDGELLDAFKRQRAFVTSIERRQERIIPWVFVWPTGKRIDRVYKYWNDAKEKVGLDRIPHDFRRTAVRTLSRSGIPREIAMQMVGHKTESMYRRYSIVDENMIREVGGKRLFEFLAEQKGKRKKVARMG